MGLMGGLLVSSQASADSSKSEEDANETTVLLAGGNCGGHGCGGQKPSSSSNRSYNSLYDDKDVAEEQVQVKVSSTQKDKPLTDSEMRAKLTKEGQSAYDKLDPDSKKLAQELAGQTCAGKNDCKGKNSCKSAGKGTAKGHDCAGKGSCAGTSEGPFDNADDAVKLASKKMAEKRAKVSKPTSWRS